MQLLDILILSNGPGELTTWVRPVVQALRQQMGNDSHQVRISLVLSPCPNASGREVEIAQTYPGIDRIQAAEHFFAFLTTGKTAENWEWRSQGVVVFLGGDQLYPVIIGKRLGYRIVIYGEWETRWHRWVDRFGVMNPNVIDRAPARYAHKLVVVGDLMAEAGGKIQDSNHNVQELIGILPGSKSAKLAQGVPLGLAIAQHIHQARPHSRFVIPVAPTLDPKTLQRFANPAENPILQMFGDVAAELRTDQVGAYLKLANGLRIDLCTDAPAYDVLSQCRLCLTTVGANTAELGALAVPMIVLIPTQQLDAMRAWDGIPGILANMPFVGTQFAKFINWWFLRKKRLLAWPNIWAGEAIVPELVGELDSRNVANIAIHWLNHPEEVEEIRRKLRQVRGAPGAAQQFAQLVQDVASQ